MIDDPPSPDSELRIAERERLARAGGSASPTHRADLDRLLEAHRDRVAALCRRMTADPARAEELTQQALLVAYERLPEFDGRARFGTWVYGIARNVCLNANRKRGDWLTDDGVLDDTSAEADAWRLLRRAERAALVHTAAARLDPVEQEVVHLRYAEEMPLADIDTMLGLDGSGARAVLQRCKRKLRTAIAEGLAEAGVGSSFFDSEA